MDKRILVVHLIKQLEGESLKKEEKIKDKHYSQRDVDSENKYNKKYNAAMKKYFNTSNWHHNDSIVYLSSEEISELEDKSKYLILTKMGLNEYAMRNSGGPRHLFKLVLGERIGEESEFGGYHAFNEGSVYHKKNKSIYIAGFNIRQGSSYRKAYAIIPILSFEEFKSAFGDKPVNDSIPKINNVVDEIPSISNEEFEVLVAIRILDYRLKVLRKFSEMANDKKSKNRKIPEGVIYSFASSLSALPIESIGSEFNKVENGNIAAIVAADSGLILIERNANSTTTTGSQAYNSTMGANTTSYTTSHYYGTKYIVLDFKTGKIYFSINIESSEEAKENKFLKEAKKHKK